MESVVTRQSVVVVALSLVAAIGLVVTLQPLSPSLDLPQWAATPQIDEAEAIAIALTDLVVGDGVVTLSHPRHDAEFSVEGVRFTPSAGGPVWHWSLATVSVASEDLAVVTPLPTIASSTTVRYDRGLLVEEWVSRADTLEQRFVLGAPLGSGDLVIEGAVDSVGTFVTTDTGWEWADTTGAVNLGDVTVYDATGATLAASMEVGATSTRIVVRGDDLAAATYPVTIDPEVGANDFRISDTGPDGDTTFDALDPAVAYNSNADEYLVVWAGEVGIFSATRIYGQLLNANGQAVGTNDFSISDKGFGNDPAVAYNPIADEYLVVWWGDDGTSSELEIYGQRLGADGSQPGTNDFRISDMGPDGNTNFRARNPAVAYNSNADEYLVVWWGDDANDEDEIYGQRLFGNDGSQAGTNDFRISDMGPNGSAFYSAHTPALAYNPTADEYLVVWWGDDTTRNENEIYGQRLFGNDGSQTGTNDFRISDMGPEGDTNPSASQPALAYNPTADEYLVVWQGTDTADVEVEIYGQRLGADGSQPGTNDFRISDMGPEGDTNYSAFQPALAYNPTADEYLVVWWGDDSTDDEREIYGQRLGADGTQTGTNDFRISDMGPDGNTNFDAQHPAVAPTADEYLVVWDGDDGIFEGFEIYGQRLSFTPHTVGLVDISKGKWYLRNSAGVVTSFFYGNPVDLPISGDWNGDGDSTPGLYRQSDGFFYARDSNTQGPADNSCFAGDPSDIPLAGDWDGDGDDNLGIYRPSEQKFYLFTITCTGSPMGAAPISFGFGNPGDKPVAGDWDGDGITEIGLHRESTGFFYWRNTLDTGIASDEIFFGDPADRFVSGDWGVVDGVDTPAIFRPGDLTYYFRHTLTQGNADSQFTWAGAGSGWLPVSGRFGLG